MEPPEKVPDPPPTRSAWVSIPNLLSLSRLAATPILVWLIVADRRLAATILLGVMGITDFLDGYIARRTGTVSDLGVILDPISDRVLVMAMIVALMWAGSLVPWLGIPVLARDVLLSVVFLVLARRGFGKPKVRKVGKAATFVLLFALPLLVWGDPLRPPGLALFALGGVLYYIAGARYVQDVRAWHIEMTVPEAHRPNSVG
jgi:cardiolipin synthase